MTCARTSVTIIRNCSRSSGSRPSSIVMCMSLGIVDDDVVDPDELVEADPAEGSAVAKLTRAFPGAALVEPT